LKNLVSCGKLILPWGVYFNIQEMGTAAYEVLSIVIRVETYEITMQYSFENFAADGQHLVNFSGGE
jgi:hypothetical protein